MSELLRRVSGLMRLGRPRPLWFDTVSANPPLSFVSPVDRQRNREKTEKSGKQTPRTASHARPAKIVYPEDKLRRKFYRDHPFELDTPIAINGLSSDAAVEPPSRDNDGEWAIQRQLQLMAQGVTKHDAHQQACAELYARRAETEIAERLAREERLEVQQETLRPMVDVLESVMLQEKTALEERRLRESKNSWK